MVRNSAQPLILPHNFAHKEGLLYLQSVRTLRGVPSVLQLKPDNFDSRLSAFGIAQKRKIHVVIRCIAHFYEKMRFSFVVQFMVVQKQKLEIFPKSCLSIPGILGPRACSSMGSLQLEYALKWRYRQLSHTRALLVATRWHLSRKHELRAHSRGAILRIIRSIIFSGKINFFYITGVK